MKRVMLVIVLAIVAASRLTMGDDASEIGRPRVVLCMPELAVAVAVDDQTVEVRRYVDRTIVRRSSQDPSDRNVKVDEGVIELTPRTETVVIQEEYVTRLPASTIEAQRIDGSAVSKAFLLKELSRPTCVLILKGDQRLSPLVAGIVAPKVLTLRFPLSTVSVNTIPVSTAPSSTVPPNIDSREER